MASCKDCGGKIPKSSKFKLCSPCGVLRLANIGGATQKQVVKEIHKARRAEKKKSK